MEVLETVGKELKGFACIEQALVAFYCYGKFYTSERNGEIHSSLVFVTFAESSAKRLVTPFESSPAHKTADCKARPEALEMGTSCEQSVLTKAFLKRATPTS